VAAGAAVRRVGRGAIRPSARTGGDQRGAIACACQPLDLPEVGLDPGSLQLPDRTDHHRGTQFSIVALLVALNTVGLLMRHRHQRM
jgi:hypothetical protein